MSGSVESIDRVKAAALELVKLRFKGNTGLARVLAANGAVGGISSQAISQWKQVPVDRVADVEAVTGVSRNLLRPDIFGNADDQAIESLFASAAKTDDIEAFGPTVYFARAGHDGPIKIGYTRKNPIERIAELQTGCPWRIRLIGSLAGEKRHEDWLHDQFDASRLEGEWFHATPALLAAIDEALSPGFAWPDSLITNENKPFAAIIDAFGGAVPFSKALGIPDTHARTMKARDSIPSGRWNRVVAAADALEIPGITLQLLADLEEARADRASSRPLSQAASLGQATPAPGLPTDFPFVRSHASAALLKGGQA